MPALLMPFFKKELQHAKTAFAQNRFCNIGSIWEEPILQVSLILRIIFNAMKIPKELKQIIRYAYKSTSLYSMEDESQNCITLTQSSAIS